MSSIKCMKNLKMKDLCMKKIKTFFYFHQFIKSNRLINIIRYIKNKKIPSLSLSHVIAFNCLLKTVAWPQISHKILFSDDTLFTNIYIIE